MKFRCPYGHVEPNPRYNPNKPTGPLNMPMKPLTHDGRNRCSIYVQLRAQGKVDVFGRYMPGVKPDGPPSSPGMPSVATTTGPGEQSPATPAEGPGAPASGEFSPQPDRQPEPGKDGLLKRLKSGLSVRYNTVTTTAQEAPGLASETQDWEISESTSIQFWRTIIGFIGTVCGLITTWLEIPQVPNGVFELDPGQEFAFKTALRGFTTNLLKKVFRAKSPEDADMVVAGLSGVLGFGMMAMKIGIHFLMYAPKSPKLAKLREKVAHNKQVRAQKKVESLQAEGKEIPPALSALASGVPA